MKIIKNQFSIILPCFNSEKTIKRTLESIERQTYQNFNIIAVDDGSNDQTLKILYDFKERVGKIKVIEHL
jgi:teichuronic acid biosynthesis glycosyltransferase TuaG